MKLVGAWAAAVTLVVVSEVRADPALDARSHRAAAYASPAALLASAHAARANDDLSRSLWLAGTASLPLLLWSAESDESFGLGAAGFALAAGTELGSGLCAGGCRTAVFGGGLAAYASVAAVDVGWFAYRGSRVDDTSRNAARWYGWRPLIGYGSLVGGLWLATVDEAGVTGAGLALAGVGLEVVPLSHFSTGQYARGWTAFGGTLLGAGLGALAACANGCDSPYAPRSRAIFEPGRALLGATAGIATWAAIDAALLSYRGEPASKSSGVKVEPYVTASPTTGRPRAGASFVF